MGTPAILVTRALSTISTFAQADARNKQAGYEAEWARQQAEYQRRLAEAEAAKIRRNANRVLGQRAARFAAAGFDLGADSILLAQQSLASEAEMRALEARNDGIYRAASLNATANLTRARARSANQQDYLSLGRYLLGDI